ncbi:MAG: T9SS type A sorting domain-containing protein [Bacteroidota bacterium]
MINLIGQTVYINIIYKKATVNTSSFAKGIYILKLSSDKETVVRKFVKE